MKLDGYDLQIVKKGDDYDPVPFSYTILYEETDSGYEYKSMCNDISCTTCRFNSDCNKGEHRSKTLADYLTTNHPEVFI